MKHETEERRAHTRKESAEMCATNNTLSVVAERRRSARLARSQAERNSHWMDTNDPHRLRIWHPWQPWHDLFLPIWLPSISFGFHGHDECQCPWLSWNPYTSLPTHLNTVDSFRLSTATMLSFNSSELIYLRDISRHESWTTSNPFTIVDLVTSIGCDAQKGKIGG